VPYAVELFLDEEAEQQVRRIWAALDRAGISSLGGIPDTHYHPHVSLSVFDQGEPARVVEALRPVLAGSAGLPLPLAPVGSFLTDEAVVFLGVVPSARLLGLHRAVHRVLEPLVDTVWPYYRPDALLPHCTLATRVTDPAAVIEIVSRFPTPISAYASGAHLVETPGGANRIALSSQDSG
jgi:hypothetical protein